MIVSHGSQCEEDLPSILPRRHYGNHYIERTCFEPEDCCTGIPSCKERLAEKQLELYEAKQGSGGVKSERRGDKSIGWMSPAERNLDIRRLESELLDLRRECGDLAFDSLVTDRCGRRVQPALPGHRLARGLRTR